jgi:hypothetical protein
MAATPAAANGNAAAARDGTRHTYHKDTVLGWEKNVDVHLVFVNSRIP